MFEQIPIELIAKIAALLAALLGIRKTYNELLDHRKSKLREQYKFTKEYIDDTTKENSHPLLIENGFAAITGKSTLTAPEIALLLSYPTPSISIERATSGLPKYLEYSTKENTFNFTKRYQSTKQRKISKILNSLGYFTYASIALFPIIFAQDLFKNEIAFGIGIITGFSLTFLPQAYFCLKEITRLQRSEKLIDSLQRTHA